MFGWGLPFPVSGLFDTLAVSEQSESTGSGLGYRDDLGAGAPSGLWTRLAPCAKMENARWRTP